MGVRLLCGFSGFFLNVQQMWAYGISLESSRSGDSKPAFFVFYIWVAGGLELISNVYCHVN